MPAHERVHKLDQDVHWGLLDDGRVVGLVDYVLQQQHEKEEDLLEAVGLAADRNIF